jgi:hypothetical protein
MGDPILIKMFWNACGLNPADGLRNQVISSGVSSVRAFVGARTPKYDPTIRGCFREEDYQHMMNGTPDYAGDPYMKFDLFKYSDVHDQAWPILNRIGRGDADPMRMPPLPDARWSQTLVDLFSKWVAGGMPP